MRTEKTSSLTAGNGQKNIQSNTGNISRMPTPEGPKENSSGGTFIGSTRNSAVEISPSMSMLDRSAEHIFALMGRITGDPVVSAISQPTVEQVNASVNCAKVITQIMRLKLDVLKVKNNVDQALLSKK